MSDVSDVLSSVGPDPLLTAFVRLLTPPLRHVYAVLLRAGIIIVVVDDYSSPLTVTRVIRRRALSDARASSSGASADARVATAVASSA